MKCAKGEKSTPTSLPSVVVLARATTWPGRARGDRRPRPRRRAHRLRALALTD